MSAASIMSVSDISFLFCHGGSVLNTGFPLMQIAEVLFPNFSFESAPNGDARIKILGLSKGKESAHISTVPYDSVRDIVRKNKLSIGVSSSKIRIVTLPGLRRLMTIHQRKPGIQMLRPFIDACVQALSPSSQSPHVEAKPQMVQEPLPILTATQQLPLLSSGAEKKDAVEATRDSGSVSRSNEETQASAEIGRKIDYVALRVNELMEIVARKQHPLIARFQWLTPISVAEIFEAPESEMIVRVQYTASKLIQDRKAEGYDIQYAPPPSSTPLFSHRLARLVVMELEKAGYKVKTGFVRP